MDAAAQTHHWMEELLQGVPMGPVVSLEQLKKRSVLWKDALKE